MPRILSAALSQAIHAPETSESLIFLVTIDHPWLEGVPIRLSSDRVHTTSRDQLYIALPFELTVPDDIEERPARAKIRIDNISREIVRFLRDVPSSEAPVMTMDLVMASRPDEVEESWGPFFMSEPEFDQLTVECELLGDDRSQEPYPEGRYTPDGFPALFIRV